jgi:hypothetical protein
MHDYVFEIVNDENMGEEIFIIRLILDLGISLK